MDYVNFDVEISNLNKILGLQLDSDKIRDCAVKMGLELVDTSDDGQKLKFEVPPTRADILHPCDVIEDIGIGYGFNNIEKVYPPTNTVGSF